MFKFYEHPEIRPEIEVMKNEVIKYQALAASIWHRVIRGKKGLEGEGHIRPI
jgi:hypothetical protein